MRNLPASLPRRLGSVAQRYRPMRMESPWSAMQTGSSLPGLTPGGATGPPRGGETGPAAREPRMARLEAVLLIAREPLASRKLAQLANLADGTQARTLVRRLNAFYDLNGTAFRVREVAGGFQLLTRPKFGGWLRRLFQAPEQTRLSGPSMETLAVVAYRQPVLRAEIEAIRGVGCGEILRQMMERDLVRISGHSDELGRPFLYGTTKRFLQIFGLRQLDELPRAQLLRGATVSGEPSDVTSRAAHELDSDSGSQDEQNEEEVAVSIDPMFDVDDSDSVPTEEPTDVDLTAADQSDIADEAEPDDDDETDDDEYEDEDEEYEDDEDEEYEEEDEDGEEEEDDDEDEDEEEDDEDLEDEDLEDDEWEEIEEGDDEEDEDDDEEWEYYDDEEEEEEE